MLEGLRPSRCPKSIGVASTQEDGSHSGTNTGLCRHTDPIATGITYRTGKTMRCKQCNSTMFQIDEQLDERTRQSWYECPLCNARQMISEACDQAAETRLGTTWRYRAPLPAVRRSPA